MAYRVPRDVLERGTKIEAKEHPELSPRVQRHIAADHVRRYGPEYYDPGVEKVTERIIEAKTKKAGIKPIRHVKERPYNPLVDGLPRTARTGPAFLRNFPF